MVFWAQNVNKKMVSVKKKACDKDDGIYPCSVGDKCNVGEDCDTGNCDPKTHICVTVKVCSDENLDLCDPLKCEDLNNQYDITGKHYVYDVGDKICKLENLDTDDDGDGVEPADGGFSFDEPLSLADVRKELTAELVRFERLQGMNFPEKPMEMKSLYVIGFVQDKSTHEALQSAVVKVTPAN